tara:strand:- start:9027 stop:9260 length:234 start_codon:yes stop_codon:yes gene_type:complete
MIVVYGRPGCNYCEDSKLVLDEAKIPYNYIDVWKDDEAKAKIKNAGLKTVPQIYDDTKHIGGFNELMIWLNEKGHCV